MKFLEVLRFPERSKFRERRETAIVQSCEKRGRRSADSLLGTAANTTSSYYPDVRTYAAGRALTHTHTYFHLRKSGRRVTHLYIGTDDPGMRLL